MAASRNSQFAGWIETERAAARAFGTAHVQAAGQNRPVDLARISWLITVGACLVAVLILVIQGYIGYAGVTLAVAICAAVNLV